MQAGRKVEVWRSQLTSIHAGIRSDTSQGAAATAAPEGAEGEVLQVAPDDKECLVELYWNPSHGAGMANTWRIRVKRMVRGAP